MSGHLNKQEVLRGVTKTVPFQFKIKKNTADKTYLQ